MNKRKYLENSLIVLVLSIILLFLDYKISIGVVVGYLFSILNYKFIEYRYNNLETYSPLFFVGSFVSIMILAIPLVLSFIYPNFMSYIGVVIGLMILRTRFIVEAFISK